jgi:hypothetical protein
VVLAVALFAPATLGGKVISAGRVVLQQPPYSPPAEPLPPADVLQSDSGTWIGVRRRGLQPQRAAAGVRRLRLAREPGAHRGDGRSAPPISPSARLP